VINLVESLIELLQGGTGHSFERKVVPMLLERVNICNNQS